MCLHSVLLIPFTLEFIECSVLLTQLIAGFLANPVTNAIY